MVRAGWGRRSRRRPSSVCRLHRGPPLSRDPQQPPPSLSPSLLLHQVPCPLPMLGLNLPVLVLLLGAWPVSASTLCPLPTRGLPEAQWTVHTSVSSMCPQQVTRDVGEVLMAPGTTFNHSEVGMWTSTHFLIPLEGRGEACPTPAPRGPDGLSPIAHKDNQLIPRLLPHLVPAFPTRFPTPSCPPGAASGIISCTPRGAALWALGLHHLAQLLNGGVGIHPVAQGVFVLFYFGAWD